MLISMIRLQMLASPVTVGVPAGAPLLVYAEICEVIRVPKPFLTYEQQIHGRD